MKAFWKTLPKPIIGLSPMDGYTDSAFRRTCKYVNSDIVTFTEFTSADGIFHSAKSLKTKLSFHSEEQPVIAQIFGKNTETFHYAAQLCEEMGFSGIDINMGCPSPKVVRSEHGVALRKKPDLAFKLVETVANATSLPVSVKTRLGWSNAEDLLKFGSGVQNAGADMICIHARTYNEPYNVPADFEPVYELKRHLSIPVLGNGGVGSLEDADVKRGNLDGILIGQAAFGNPWVFSSDKMPPSFDQKLEIIRLHAQWLTELKGEERGIKEMRKHLLSYIKDIKGARFFRSKCARVSSIKETESILDEIRNALNLYCFDIESLTTQNRK